LADHWRVLLGLEPDGRRRQTERKDVSQEAPTQSDATTDARRMGIYGAVSTIVGIILSGPLAVAVVGATHPQPPWAGPELFARAFHPVQILPYPGGIVLVAGLVILLASIHAAAERRERALATAALVFAAVFATLIFFNYVVQTAFIPALATAYTPTNAPILAAFSMANPRSLAWALEMWGWGFLGVATWLIAPVFRGAGLARAARWTFVANGPVSIAGAVWTAVRPGWVLTNAGLIAFGLWNLLLLAMAALALAIFRGVGSPTSRATGEVRQFHGSSGWRRHEDFLRHDP
jgi:hypothetical protein